MVGEDSWHKSRRELIGGGCLRDIWLRSNKRRHKVLPDQLTTTVLVETYPLCH